MIFALQMGGPGMAMLIQFGVLIAIMYFLLIMPQRREAKRHREMLAALKRGDEVVTMGGLVGEIIHLNDALVTLKTGESRVVVERARIARLATAVGGPAK
jgi:preprotein translocase subunit YajC